MTTTAKTETRAFAGDLTAVWTNATGSWTVFRAAQLVGAVAEDYDGFAVHPVNWPHPDGSGNQPTLSAAVRSLRQHADRPLTAPTTQAQHPGWRRAWCGTWATAPAPTTGATC